MAVTSQAPVSENEPVIERVSPVSRRVVSIERAHDKPTCLNFAARAASAFPDWSAMHASERASYLIKAADILQKRREDFSSAMIDEIGAPQEWCSENVDFAADMLRQVATYADETERVEAVHEDRGVVSSVTRVPCGVCLGISPWNAPLILGVRSIAAPLLCGNTVLLKGSEFAPRVFRLLGEVLQASGLTEDVARVILTRAEDSEEIVEALIASPVVRRVNFTGSTRVGRLVAELCAKHLKRPLLELGGQSTMLVLDDADIELAAAAALKGAYLNQGQICMSTERLIVVDAVADELVERIEAGRKKLRHGDPNVAETKVGPVISIAAAERLSGLISDAVSKGAQLVGGGRVRDCYLEPTLLDGVEPDMRIYREELFGPVLSVTRIANDLEAVTVANDSEYGLACAVFSTDQDRAEAVARQVHSGICHINRCTVDDNPHAPFGGVKSSGYGRFGGRWAIQEFTELRWISSAAAGG